MEIIKDYDCDKCIYSLGSYGCDSPRMLDLLGIIKSYYGITKIFKVCERYEEKEDDSEKV